MLYAPSAEKPILTGKVFIKELAFSLLRDPSAFSLLFSNIVVIGLAIRDSWSLSTLLAAYLAQSVIIGVFTLIKILSLKNFSTEGFKIGNESVEPTRETQRRCAFLFALTYGFFHFIYTIFVIVDSTGGVIEMRHVFSGAVYFLAHHTYSFFRHGHEREKLQNIGKVMIFPFVRILPMHLSIIFGTFIISILKFNWLGVLFFIVLKTMADILMHVIEHFQWERFGREMESKYSILSMKKEADGGRSE